jgi:hypothetical protein
VHGQPDANTFAAAWAEGDAMNVEQAVDRALELLSEPKAEHAAAR